MLNSMREQVKIFKGIVALLNLMFQEDHNGSFEPVKHRISCYNTA